METAGSVSKGCFVYKGKKTRAKIEDYLPEDKTGGAQRRHEGFEQMYEEIDIQIQILQSDLNTKIFEDLVHFAKQGHEKFSLESETKKSQQSEIPTAALITGVNTPDHGVMFRTLGSLLRERVTPLVAGLRAKDCATVKAMLGKTLSQLLDNPHLEHDDEDLVDDIDIKSKNLPLTLSTLAKWYHVHYKAGASSPKKKKKASDGGELPRQEYPPVIVVLEDFESFSPKVVQDFISISSTYISQLPLVFVFGIATSVSAVHRLLPNEVSCLLCMEKFQAPPSSDYLTSVLNKVIMTPSVAFKLGPKVFQLLLDIFLYHDFSVINFIKGLRFSLLDHYSHQPMSNLCCSLEEGLVAIKALNKASVEQVRQLPSFMRYVEACDVSEQSDLLLNDQVTKEHASKLIQALHTYHDRFFPALRCLHSLVSKLPGYPLGKQLREVYSASLESGMFESEAYTHALSLLKLLSKTELSQLVEQCLAPLTDKCWTTVRDHIIELRHKLDNLDESAMLEVEEEDGASPASLPTKTSLHQLRQQLQDISKRRKRLSPYEKLRIEVVDYLDSVFKEHLKCPKTQPLYEVFYYDRASTVKRHLNASPRSAIQTALSNPNHYLQCECCKSESGQVCSTMPDVCIVYKLHLECGQLINLYDWMQAFITVVQPEEDGDKETKLDTKLQARFIRAVSELQFLGFIKPTKRKTDHVARLTWGGC